MKTQIKIGDKVRIVVSDDISKRFHGKIGTVVGIGYTVRLLDTDFIQVTGLEECELILMNGDDISKVNNDIKE